MTAAQSGFGPGFDRTWRARFERFGRSYPGDAEVSGWSPVGLAARLRAFEAVVPRLALAPGSRVLDLGCGAGTYVRVLARLGFRPIGVDYSLPSLGRAVAADPGGRGRYLGADAYGLPFRPEVFDLVVAIGVLQAMGEPERALDEIARVVRPGGCVVLEALSQVGVAARLKRLLDGARGTPPRVRTYDPGMVATELEGRGLVLVDRIPLCLPPRGLPGSARLAGTAALPRALRRWEGLGRALAHTFLLAARRRQDPETTT
jgi:SAM-dependent methyltransferase